MTVGIGTLAWQIFFSRGDIFGGLAYLMTNFPIPNFGLLWILLGGGMYAVLFAKTDGDFGITGAILTIYLAMVSAMFTPALWIVFALVLIFHMAIMLIKIFLR